METTLPTTQENATPAPALPNHVPITCLQCGCVGLINSSDPNQITINKSSLCACTTCEIRQHETSLDSSIQNPDKNYYGCVYSNIQSCKLCKELYQLRWNSVQNKYHFVCPNSCVIQPASRRLASINDNNVNNALPPWNRTLLHSAVQTCDVEFIWELLQKGANPFAKDYRDITPIEIAHSMSRTFSASNSFGTGKHKKQYCDRLEQIIRILPARKFSPSHRFISPLPAQRYLSEGTHHSLSKSQGNTNDCSFPLPPDVVRSVTSPGRSHAASNLTSLPNPNPHVANPLPPPSLENNKPVVQDQQNIATAGPQKAIEEGTQMYTPLTLMRLTSEADGVVATLDLFGEDDADISFSEEWKNILDTISHTESKIDDSKQQLSSAELTSWKISELTRAVALDSDIEEKHLFTEGSYICTACMEEIDVTALGYTCPVLGCNGTLCLDCFVRLAAAIISSARYAVPVIRCPGGCMSRIPTKVWRGVLITQPATPSILEMFDTYDTPDAGSLIYKKYCNNAEALMKLRCGCCHQTCDLFYEEPNDSIPLTFDDRLDVVTNLLLPFNQEEQILFLRTWLLYNKGKLSTDTLVTVFSDLFEKLVVDEYDKQNCKDGLFTALQAVVKPALLLFCDVERRLCAQLGFFRAFPKITTTCCYENHCFMCKVYGHHEGMTCEEMQQNEIGIEAQYCPACGVPTLRTEGCDHIVCVCGMEWEWSGSSNDY